MKSYEVIGYTVDASIMCLDCFKARGYEPDGEDSEGNPAHPVFAGDECADEETCQECGELLVEVWKP